MGFLVYLISAFLGYIFFLQPLMSFFIGIPLSFNTPVFKKVRVKYIGNIILGIIAFIVVIIGLFTFLKKYILAVCLGYFATQIIVGFFTWHGFASEVRDEVNQLIQEEKEINSQSRNQKSIIGHNKTDENEKISCFIRENEDLHLFIASFDDTMITLYDLDKLTPKGINFYLINYISIKKLETDESKIIFTISQSQSFPGSPIDVTQEGYTYELNFFKDEDKIKFIAQIQSYYYDINIE